MVCDRGVRHTRNEDAGAVAATSEPGGFAVLVVCDGVSSAVDSDRASLAAVRAARAVLVAQPAAPSNPADAVTDDEDARRAVLEDAVRRSAAAADREAVEAAVDPREPNPPSCTFVVAVVEGPLLVAGWVGDSRAYWLPDDGPPEQLSVDDSWASEAMAHGMTREEAESGPHAHAITRWLGVDAPDPVPRTTARRLDRAGWVLVCSDGLWNYASAADDVQRLLVDVLDGTVTAADPARVSEELVAWANRQGGQDNVTVALARVAVEAPEPE
jgi:serine/threonine protein phosphatase PrpC